MCDDSLSRHTISINQQFAEQLLATYPAANTVPQAITLAADDGVKYKQAIEGDLECYVRALARDEVKRLDRGELADD